MLFRLASEESDMPGTCTIPPKVEREFSHVAVRENYRSSVSHSLRISNMLVNVLYYLTILHVPTIMALTQIQPLHARKW